jgi:hypothetical protein
LTDTLVKAFGVDTSKQRLDSTLIRSNMRKLGRNRIFAATIRKFLKKLKREHPDLFDTLVGSEFCDRYLGKESEGCFSQVKPSEASRTLDELAYDLVYLVELFSSYDPVQKLSEYKLLERVLHDQCLITDMPLFIFEGQTGNLVTSILHPGKHPDCREIRSIIKRVIKRIRSAWPKVGILVRGDSHFATPKLYSWCDNHTVHYILGL